MRYRLDNGRKSKKSIGDNGFVTLIDIQILFKHWPIEL